MSLKVFAKWAVGSSWQVVKSNGELLLCNRWWWIHTNSRKNDCHRPHLIETLLWCMYTACKVCCVTALTFLNLIPQIDTRLWIMHRMALLHNDWSMFYLKWNKGHCGCSRLALGETRHWCFVLWLKLKHSCIALVRWWEKEEHTDLVCCCRIQYLGQADPARLHRADKVWPGACKKKKAPWQRLNTHPVGVMNVHKDNRLTETRAQELCQGSWWIEDLQCIRCGHLLIRSSTNVAPLWESPTDRSSDLWDKVWTHWLSACLL